MYRTDIKKLANLQFICIFHEQSGTGSEIEVKAGSGSDNFFFWSTTLPVRVPYSVIKQANTYARNKYGIFLIGSRPTNSITASSLAASSYWPSGLFMSEQTLARNVLGAIPALAVSWVASTILAPMFQIYKVLTHVRLRGSVSWLNGSGSYPWQQIS